MQLVLHMRLFVIFNDTCTYVPDILLYSIPASLKFVFQENCMIFWYDYFFKVVTKTLGVKYFSKILSQLTPILF